MNVFESIYKELFTAYGRQGWWPLISHRNKKGFDERGYHDRSRVMSQSDRFEVSVGAILTQSTSWKNVEKALLALEAAHALNKEATRSMDPRKLSKVIKSAGYHNQKAKKLKSFAAHDAVISRDALLAVWGIGPETADSILLYAYHEPRFVVDAYTRRILSRMGLCASDASYDELQSLFHHHLERDAEQYNEYHALLVEHAKRHCRVKPICAGCPLSKKCKKLTHR